MDIIDRIIREPERKRIMGTSCTTQWRQELADKAPRRIILGTNSVGWRLSEIVDWLNSRETVTSENVKPVAPGCTTRGRKKTSAGKVER